MNINKEQIDDLNIVLSVQIGKDDYGDKVNEVLRDFRRKANMPGFRPGKVPEGLIRKMYGKAVLIDEINKLLPEAINNYIKEQEFKLLGDPLPKANSDDLDWEIGNDFTFDFEMGLAPDIEVNLSKNDHLTKYQIVVEQDLITKNIENYASRFGQFVDVDAIVDFTEKLTVDIVQLSQDGQPMPDSLSVEESAILLSLIKDEERKKSFENIKAGDEIIFNLWETFPNKWEVASILKMKSDELGDISECLFKFTVTNIQKYVNAEVNQDLFDKILGEGKVKSFEEFETHIRENIESEFMESGMAKFNNDAREYLIEKINPPLPENFLRKWLLKSNTELDEEVLEKEFPMFLKNTKWEVMVNIIAKQHELKVEEWEIVNNAKIYTQRHLARYGAYNFTDEDMTNYAMNYLKEEKNAQEMASQVIGNKVFKIIFDAVEVNVQEISIDDFNKMVYSSENEEAVETGETGEAVETGEAEEAVEVEEKIEETEKIVEETEEAEEAVAEEVNEETNVKLII